MHACMRPRKTFFAGFKDYSDLMHAISDTQAQCMHVWQYAEICFASMDALFKRSQEIRGTVHTTQVFKVDVSHHGRT